MCAKNNFRRKFNETAKTRAYPLRVSRRHGHYAIEAFCNPTARENKHLKSVAKISLSHDDKTGTADANQTTISLRSMIFFCTLYNLQQPGPAFHLWRFMRVELRIVMS